ncbi:hypothetical protein PCE1_000928 [Barthelona sp. PCE]
MLPILSFKDLTNIKSPKPHKKTVVNSDVLDIRANIRNWSKEMAKKDNEYKLSKKRQEKYKKQLNIAKTKLKEVVREKVELKSRITVFEQNISSLKTQVRGNTTLFQLLKVNQEKMEQLSSTYEANNASMTDRIQQVSDDVGTININTEINDELVSGLRAENANLFSELSEANETISELKNSNSFLKQDIVNSKLEHNVLVNDNEKLHREIKKVSDSLSDHVSRIEELHVTVSANNADLEAARVTIDDVQEQLRQEQTKNWELSCSNSELSNKLSEFALIISEIKINFEERCNELEQDACNDLETFNIRLTEIHNHFNTIISKKHGQMENMNAQYTQLNISYEDLKHTYTREQCTQAANLDRIITEHNNEVTRLKGLVTTSENRVSSLISEAEQAHIEIENLKSALNKRHNTSSTTFSAAGDGSERMLGVSLSARKSQMNITTKHRRPQPMAQTTPMMISTPIQEADVTPRKKKKSRKSSKKRSPKKSKSHRRKQDDIFDNVFEFDAKSR